MRKEQVVLIGTVAVLGFLAYRSFGSQSKTSATVKKAEAPPFAHHVAPDASLVLPEKRASAENTRDLFSPPSDTRPLPPLDLVPPPFAPFAALRPPTSPGPGVALFGKFLRTPPAPFDAPDVFVEAEATADAAAAAAPAKKSDAALSQEEFGSRIPSFKKLYDWVRLVEFRFGQIANPDRYALAKRPNEDILFVEFNPQTGLPKFPTQPPLVIPRKNVAEFDFAQTVPNQIEIRRAQFSTPLQASEYDAALQFADWCIDQRLITPRALVVAEEIFRRASAVLTEDPAPRLGLARVYEASFQFEKAFGEYQALLAGNLQHNPLVLVSLAELEARFRMFSNAEERLVEAERFGRTQWQVQAALGNFLLARGRATDAVVHLRLANQYEPSGPEFKRARTDLRSDLGAGLLATGEVAEAREWFEKALQSDPQDQRAQAGLVSATVMSGKPAASDSNVGVGGEATSVGFDLLVARGLEQLAKRTPEAAKKAKENFVAAAAADPLRANIPWRALSFLAESTNHPEEALRYAELAIENDPSDPWTLFQRARLLAAKDDLDGAQEAFTAALDRDVGFVDALAALGELAHRRGDFSSAERYFERALMLDPSLVNVLALRGVNFLQMNAFRDAEECFRRALTQEQDQPTARNGLAWCYYRKGDPTEALTRLRELDDNRRAFAENDPHRVWARAQIERLTDHLQKFVWSDRFDRNTLLNGWQSQENSGPTISIHDGLVTLAGAFKSNGRTRLYQVRSAGDFVSIEARVTIHTGTTSRVGLFVSREMQRGGESQVEAEVTVSRHNDPAKNTLQTRAMKRGEEDMPYTDVPGFEWKFDQPMTVKIERYGDSSDTKVRVSFDGFPVLDGKAMPTLGRTNNDLFLGIFAEGQTGRTVQVDIDDVDIVYRQRGK